LKRGGQHKPGSFGFGKEPKRQSGSHYEEKTPKANREMSRRNIQTRDKKGQAGSRKEAARKEKGVEFSN